MVNKAHLIGRLGTNPDVHTFENGNKKASFSLATSESWKDKDGNKQEKTEWHNIVAFRGLAEISEKYLNQGDLVYIEGKITTRSWEQDGQKKYMTEIVVLNMTMLGRKKVAEESPNQPPDDDLPF